MVFVLDVSPCMSSRVMPINNYDSNSFFGRDDVANAIIKQALDGQANAQQSRSQLIESPAKRGKSWLLCRIQELVRHNALSPPAAQQQQSSTSQTTTRVAVCLFTNEHAQSLNVCELVAWLWLALYPHFPHLPWPPSILNSDTEQEKISKLCAFFQLQQFDTSRLIEVAKEDLENSDPTVYLIILVDGLDEFEKKKLGRFEREFLSVLFSSDKVRVVASRRSESASKNYRRCLH